VTKKESLQLPTTNLKEYFEIYPRDERNYNTFIRGLGELGLYEEAKKAIEDMKLHGISPNVHIYTSLMTACVTIKNSDEAFRIYELMKSGLFLFLSFYCFFPAIFLFFGLHIHYLGDKFPAIFLLSPSTHSRFVTSDNKTFDLRSVVISYLSL
jgi:pentatricopeptide repeat protein